MPSIPKATTTLAYRHRVNILIIKNNRQIYEQLEFESDSKELSELYFQSALQRLFDKHNVQN